ncbi:MAG: CDP-diacylglycerol--glycerol-3-phosphate 3-phosphatidyltransferase [Planctomycetota bacterium]
MAAIEKETEAAPDSAPQDLKKDITGLLPMTLPNKITIFRFALSIPYFAVLVAAMEFGWWQPSSPTATILYDVAIVLFLVALVSDVLDGYIARKRSLSSGFGRVADPAADKILICGTLILMPADVVHPAMTLLILTREIAVQGIRGFFESLGIAFGADWWGKRKMAIQSVALGAALVYLAHFRGAGAGYLWFIRGVLWFAVLATVVSGVQYFRRAAAAIPEEKRP